MAKAGKKNTTLAEHPNVVEHFRRQEEMHKILDKAVDGLFGTPRASSAIPAGSRNQQLIKQFIDEEFPNGWENVETCVIIKRVGDRIMAMGHKVPSRDTFSRALGRRKG
jgi:hypothetical protein